MLTCAIFVASAFPGGAATPTDKAKLWQARFDHEPHATDKIRILEHLADAQFEDATRAGDTGDYTEVGIIFEKYRDNVRVAFDLLKKQEPDSDKHPNGYRHLELEARRGIREAEQTILVVHPDVRPPLELVRNDIVKIDDELIHLLFPRRTAEPAKVPPPSPQSSPAAPSSVTSAPEANP